MKIEVVKKGVNRASADIVCPYFLDIPPEAAKK
jgi:hypothetical protein